MIIEVLDAANGDAAIVRHVSGDGSAVVGLIDGGPPSIWSRAIRPALETHGIGSGSGGLDWLMVSHVDDDHVGGVLALVRAGVAVKRFFYNTPGRFPTVGDTSPAGASGHVRSRLGAEMEDLLGALAQELVPVSFKQGKELFELVVQGDAERLNPPGNQRLLSGDEWELDGLTFRVVAPSKKRLDALFRKWESAVTPASAKTTDNSVTNLSSLAVLIEEAGRTALFTGDGLEDDIVAGLEQLGYRLPLHVDVLKVPHHGSDSASNPKSIAAGRGLLESVTADHYIVSANGASRNPSVETFRRIVIARELAGDDQRSCSILLPSPPTDWTTERGRDYLELLDALERMCAQSPAEVEVVMGAGAPLVIHLP